MKASLRWIALLLGTLLPASALAAPGTGLPTLSEPIDRSTPRQTVQEYLAAATAGDWERAAYALDLRGTVPPDERPQDGPRLAEQLKRVLDRQLFIEVSELPDDSDAGGESHEIELGTVPLDSRAIPVELSRVRGEGGADVWVFSRGTVARIPALYAQHGPSWIEERMPPMLIEARWLDLAAWQWIGIAAGLLLSILLSFLLTWVTLRVSGKIAARTRATWDDRLIGILRGPSRLFLTLFFYWGALQALDLSMFTQQVVNKLAQIALSVAAAWLLTRLLAFFTEILEENAVARAETVHDELRIRGVRTQMRMTRRVGNIVIGILATAVILLQFDAVRSIGMSVLASAGVAGIVLGIAAQRSLGGLLAGIQLSVTQPLRIGDTVIIEGEWGTVEEINLTYVIVKVWDERRLVVPVPNLLESSFENWTRVSPELLGTVYLYVDYRLPVEAVREELDRILEGDDKFDGRVKSVLVTGATDRVMEVRALVSAQNATDIWALRCRVREKLVSWLQRYEDGEYLPRARVELERDEATAR